MPYLAIWAVSLLTNNLIITSPPVNIETILSFFDVNKAHHPHQPKSLLNLFH